MPSTPTPTDLELLARSRALADPTRHAIFTAVRDAADPPSVAELTDRFGLNHNAVRQHLAKLRDAGLVEEHRAPPSGPGRPPARFRAVVAADDRLRSTEASELLALMLLELVRGSDDPLAVGREAGRRLAEEGGPTRGAVPDLDRVARRLGFEPEVRERGCGADVVLARCPFVGPASAAPDVVCRLHRGLAEGVAERAGDGAQVTDLVARPPARAGCRIEVRPRP